MNDAASRFGQISAEAANTVIEAAMAYAASSTIGFMKLDHSGANITNAYPIGSGTLARLGEVCGVLTAAHVLRTLPTKDEFGIVRFASRSTVQKIQTSVPEVDRVAVGVPNESMHGPDIAFMRMPQNVVDWLNALGSKFVNIAKSKDARLEGKREGLQFLRAISGVVSERTRRSTSGRDLLVSVEASFTMGKPKNKRIHDGFDLVDFEITESDATPSSFGGTSGGGLWRIPIFSSDHSIAASPSLDGVAFFESREKSLRVITCHGPDSIYVHLHRLINDRWPQPSG